LVHQLSPSEVVPKPLGSTKAKSSADTTADYATIVEITVTKDKTFHLAKVVVSCPEDVIFKLLWNGEDVSIEYYVMGKLPFTDWFPWDWNPCAGDGVKKFELQAKYPPGGTADTIHAEICGEEV
jgi:hypothetical protein